MADKARPRPKPADPVINTLEEFHGNLRITLFSKLQSLPPNVCGAALLVAAGTIGELAALITNGDQRLLKDCWDEMRRKADQMTKLSAEEQKARLASLNGQIEMLTGRHKRERGLIHLGKTVAAWATGR